MDGRLAVVSCDIDTCSTCDQCVVASVWPFQLVQNRAVRPALPRASLGAPRARSHRASVGGLCARSRGPCRGPVRGSMRRGRWQRRCACLQRRQLSRALVRLFGAADADVVEDAHVVSAALGDCEAQASACAQAHPGLAASCTLSRPSQTFRESSQKRIFAILSPASAVE